MNLSHGRKWKHPKENINKVSIYRKPKFIPEILRRYNIGKRINIILYIKKINEEYPKIISIDAESDQTRGKNSWHGGMKKSSFSLNGGMLKSFPFDISTTLTLLIRKAGALLHLLDLL